MPARGADGDELRDRAGLELLERVGHERHHVGEVGAEHRLHRARFGEGLEAVPALEGQGADAAQRAVEIGQGEKHVIAARPDVEGVAVHRRQAVAWMVSSL